jgi:hypothetical protein
MITPGNISGSAILQAESLLCGFTLTGAVFKYTRIAIA